ncbi:MAG: hypothetical protein WAX04_08390 [Oscillospiraceae bacterium]
MEQVFDLREFIVNIFKKFKLVIIMAVVFGLLGGIFGFMRVGSDKFTTTSAGSVNIVTNRATDATALTSAMTSIKDTVSGDFFYTGVLNSIKQNVDGGEFNQIFGGQKQPSIASLKEIIRIYVNGNLVLIEVTTTNEALSVEASNAGRKYVIEQLGKNINNIEVKEQRQQTVNTSLQNGDTPKGKAIKFGILGFGGGLVLAVLWIFFIDIMSLKVKSADDLKKYNMPILGEITKG